MAGVQDLPQGAMSDPYAKEKAKADNVPDPRTVTKLHTYDDLDTGKQAHHHSVGIGGNQSAAGNHAHNGSDSIQLLAGTTLTGSQGGNTSLPSIIAALVALGATDNTTP